MIGREAAKDAEDAEDEVTKVEEAGVVVVVEAEAVVGEAEAVVGEVVEEEVVVATTGGAMARTLNKSTENVRTRTVHVLAWSSQRCY